MGRQLGLFNGTLCTKVIVTRIPYCNAVADFRSRQAIFCMPQRARNGFQPRCGEHLLHDPGLSSFFPRTHSRIIHLRHRLSPIFRHVVRVTDDRATDIERATLLHLRADPYVAGRVVPVAEPMLGHLADQRGIRVARPHIASAAFYEPPCD